MMVEEKREKEENLIEIRMVIRKTWDHTIDLREEFVPKKGKICLLSRIEREKV